MKTVLIAAAVLASTSAFAGQDYCGRISSVGTGFILHERGKPDIDISSDNPDMKDPKNVYDYLNTKHPDSDRSCYCVSGTVVVQKHGNEMLRDFMKLDGLKHCGGAVIIK